MGRRTSGSRGAGKLIVRVFCEGESEQAYVDFLREEFRDVAVISYPKETGATELFERASERFKKDPSYRDYKEVIDEVWFFFDIETKDANKWEKRYQIIKSLRKMRKDKKVRVRLLMTTGCIEYWLMLHKRYYVPQLQTVADKDRVIADLCLEEPTYKKGKKEVTAKIARDYPIAVRNARKTMENLLRDGMPGIEDTDVRNQWLCKKCKTFSNVYEAIEYLEKI